MKGECNMKETELGKITFTVRIQLTLLDKYNKKYTYFRSIFWRKNKEEK